MQSNEDLFFIGLSALSLYILANTPWVSYPDYVLKDLEQSKVVVKKGEIKLPELNILIRVIKPKAGKKYYPWSPDNEIIFEIENLSDSEVELYITLDLIVKYPSNYSVVSEALKAMFPWLVFAVAGYNMIVANIVKSVLKKDYITLTLKPKEKKQVRVVFPFTKFSIPIPFVYVEHDLIIKVLDKFGRRIIREVKYYIGYP